MNKIEIELLSAKKISGISKNTGKAYEFVKISALIMEEQERKFFEAVLAVGEQVPSQVSGKFYLVIDLKVNFKHEIESIYKIEKI